MADRYYSEPRPEIRELIRAAGAAVLDVGCGEGALGDSLKRDGATYVAGVEMHHSAVAVARQKLDFVAEGSILDVALPFDEGRFDYLIFADVLEHLSDPDRALQRCLRYLKPGGYVVISVPNWRFYLVMFRLLVDRWEYSDSGVRDRTHLRVFTRYSLEQFLFRNGLELERLARNSRLFDDQSQIGRWGALATRLANATIARWPFSDLMAYQYVVLARKARC